MTERVTVKVKSGQALIAPDGRLIRAGETVEVARHEAEFFERMGAAEIVPEAEVVVPEAKATDPKPARNAKTGQKSPV